MKENVLELKIGDSIDYKIRFITYNIYNINNEKFEITCTCDGWQIVEVSRSRLIEALNQNDFFDLFQ